MRLISSTDARLGQLDRAEAVLRAAVALDPGFEQAHALLARLLSVRGKAAEDE